jgi:hypothetical protein
LAKNIVESPYLNIFIWALLHRRIAIAKLFWISGEVKFVFIRNKTTFLQLMIINILEPNFQCLISFWTAQKAIPNCYRPERQITNDAKLDFCQNSFK